MEEQKEVIENEHKSSLEKLKEREEEIRQLHKVYTPHCFFNLPLFAVCVVRLQ